tara:strand:+ start:70 stop:285 length:216 start_codon:yes stop_codon:yes gene_type:complete
MNMEKKTIYDVFNMLTGTYENDMTQEETQEILEQFEADLEVMNAEYKIVKKIIEQHLVEVEKNVESKDLLK